MDDGRRVRFAKVNCDQWPGACRTASVQAYPSVRFYGGKTGWSPQNPVGVAMTSERRKVDDVIAWIEDLLTQQQQGTSGNSYNSRDEL